MSEQENLDIGKVIGLIMENPALIEQIANLAKPKAEEKEAYSMPRAKAPTKCSIKQTKRKRRKCL